MTTIRELIEELTLIEAYDPQEYPSRIVILPVHVQEDGGINSNACLLVTDKGVKVLLIVQRPQELHRCNP